MPYEDRGPRLRRAVGASSMSSQAPENTQSAALRRSEAYLAETQRLTRTGSFAIEVATQAVTYSSAEHSRLYGFDPADGLPSISDFFARIHPDDRALCMEVMSKGIRELTDVEVRSEEHTSELQSLAYL